MKNKTLNAGRWIVPLVVLLGLSAPGHAGAGSSWEWEITSTIEIPGSAYDMPSTVLRYCLEEQAVPYQEREDQRCETIFKQVLAKTVTWQIHCDGEDGQIEMNGVTTYNNDTMKSDVEMITEQGDMTMRMTGKRLGPCQ